MKGTSFASTLIERRYMRIAAPFARTPTPRPSRGISARRRCGCHRCSGQFGFPRRRGSRLGSDRYHSLVSMQPQSARWCNRESSASQAHRRIATSHTRSPRTNSDAPSPASRDRSRVSELRNVPSFPSRDVAAATQAATLIPVLTAACSMRLRHESVLLPRAARSEDRTAPPTKSASGNHSLKRKFSPPGLFFQSVKSMT